MVLGGWQVVGCLTEAGDYRMIVGAESSPEAAPVVVDSRLPGPGRGRSRPWEIACEVNLDVKDENLG